MKALGSFMTLAGRAVGIASASRLGLADVAVPRMSWMLAALLVSSMGILQAGEIHFKAQSFSCRLESATRPDPVLGTAIVFFTTADGDHEKFPLWQDLGGGQRLFSGELQPNRNHWGEIVPGEYLTDFVIHSAATSNDVEYGSLWLRLPTMDGDQDGLADWLDFELPVNTPFVGEWHRDWPTPAVLPVTGLLSRAAMTLTGQYAFSVVAPTNMVTWTGTWRLRELSGTGAFTRTQQNILHLALPHTDLTGQTHSLTGLTAFAVTDTDTLKVTEVLLASTNYTIYWPYENLLRSGTNYHGLAQINSTPEFGDWLAYSDWLVEFTAPDDTDTNGIPDFTDLVPGWPIIYRQPQSFTLVQGAPGLLSVEAGGDAPLSFQWMTNGMPLVGETNFSLALPGFQSTGTFSFSVWVSNAVGVAWSDTAQIQVLSPWLGPVEPEWVNFAGFTQGYTDSRMRLDAATNIFVLSRSYYYYGSGLAKFDSQGHGLWGHGMAARDFTLDAAGNSYVTGKVLGEGGQHFDCETIKFDPAGNMLWTAHYDAGISRDEAGTAISLDNDGNVLVAGYAARANYGVDFLNIKYSTAGDELWLRRADLTNAPLSPLIAVAPEGAIYVAERAGMLKYSATGELLWSQGETNRWPVVLTFDASGNPISAYSYLNGGAYEYGIAKQSSAGDLLWERRYPGALAKDLRLDLAGNIALAASASIGGNYRTHRFAPDGTELWERFYNGPGNNTDTAYALALDASANVYVTGGSYGANNQFEFATIKYDSAGNQSWVARYYSPDYFNLYASFATAIAVDAGANVYVVGAANGNQLKLIKYIQNQPGAQARPASQMAVSGSTVAIGGFFYGQPPVTYQWRFNNSDLPGATNATLLLTNVQPEQAGEYVVLIHGPDGDSFSRPSTLSVTLPSVARVGLGRDDWSGLFYVTLTGDAGWPYLIERSTNLAQWTPFVMLTPSTDGAAHMDSTPPNQLRFYRARRLP